MNTSAPGPGERPEGQEAPDDAAADAGSESPEEGAAAMAAAEDATVDRDGD